MIRFNKYILLLMIFFTINSCEKTQEKQNADFFNRIKGVWPYSENKQSLSDRVFSWGAGKYILNDSIIIDYIDNGKTLIIENPGLGDFIVKSIIEKPSGELEVFLEKSKSNMIENIPIKGSILIKFISDTSITIDDSNFAHIFGSPSNKIFNRISP